MVKRERLGDSEASFDRISALYDEVLGFILSLLPLKEAAATSVLSRRWKYLWTSTRNLYFDGRTIMIMSNSQRTKSLLPGNNIRSRFIRYVDEVVAACCSSPSRTTLEEFGVFFSLTRVYTRTIDNWLRFAVSRKVEKLELILTSVYGSDEFYDFPYKEGIFPNDFSFIKKLSTRCVNVSGEALEFFLGNCPLLEQLSVSDSCYLQTLRVSGTSAAFKCLEISSCVNLTSVVVCDSKLESFKYCGRIINNFQLSNVPRLTEIAVRIFLWDLPSFSKHGVEMFSCVFPQIERLNVNFRFVETYADLTTNFFSSAKLPNVKELVVRIWGDCSGNVSLLPLINLIKASPNVQRLVLEAPSMISTGAKPFLSSCSSGKQALRGAYCQQLKEVEFVGYHGVQCQFLLLEHLLENFATIENIFVDTRALNSTTFQHPWVRDYQPQTKDEMLARVYNAKMELEKCIPSRINLKVLKIMRMLMNDSEVMNLLISSYLNMVLHLLIPSFFSAKLNFDAKSEVSGFTHLTE